MAGVSFPLRNDILGKLKNAIKSKALEPILLENHSRRRRPRRLAEKKLNIMNRRTIFAFSSSLIMMLLPIFHSISYLVLSVATWDGIIYAGGNIYVQAKPAPIKNKQEQSTSPAEQSRGTCEQQTNMVGAVTGTAALAPPTETTQSQDLLAKMMSFPLPGGVGPDGTGPKTTFRFKDRSGREQVFEIPGDLKDVVKQKQLKEAMDSVVKTAMEDMKRQEQQRLLMTQSQQPPQQMMQRQLNGRVATAAAGTAVSTDKIAESVPQRVMEEIEKMRNLHAYLSANEGINSDNTGDQSIPPQATTTLPNECRSDTGGQQQQQQALPYKFPIKDTSQSKPGTSSPEPQREALKAENAAKSAAEKKLQQEMTQLKKRELEVLTHFFREIRVSNPHLKRDWNWLNPPHDYCKWRGITCGMASNAATAAVGMPMAPPYAVTGIHLPFAGIVSSTIPSSLFKLQYLETLILSNNLIAGNLSSFATATTLKRLRHFDMSRNSLTGSIPAHFLSGSKNLTELRLASNYLNGTLDDVFSNASLPLPKSNSDSSACSQTIESDSLTINATKSNRSLSTGSNKTNATSFSAGNQTIVSYAQSGNWTRLRLIDLSDNAISGSLPSAIGNLSSLEYLLLSENLIHGSLPTQTRALAKLNLFHAERNLLNGSLEATVNSLPRESIADVNLGDNSLNGSIPASLLQLSKLETLVFSNNEISGTIPRNGTSKKETWSEMKRLAIFWVDRNLISGSIPRQFFMGLQGSLMK